MCSQRTLFTPTLQPTSESSELAKEIISSLSDEGADSELGDLPRLTEDDIVVHVSLAMCVNMYVFSIFKTLLNMRSLCFGFYFSTAQQYMPVYDH